MNNGRRRFFVSGTALFRQPRNELQSGFETLRGSYSLRVAARWRRIHA